MGGCCSRPNGEPPSELVEPAIGIAELRLFPQQQLASGAQLCLSTAGWLAALPFTGFSVVHVTTSWAFVALFDDEDPASLAASTCRQRALSAFSGCLSTAKGDVKEALRRTFGELDSLVAGRSRKQGMTGGGARPALRCEGVIIVLDLASGVCYNAASAGARSAAAVCSVLGAFNSESSEGRFLNRPARQEDVPAGAWGRGGGSVLVTAHKLSFEHKQVLIGSSGFWALATAEEAALRLHSVRRAGGNRSSTTPGFKDGGPAAAAGACSSSGGCSNMAETMVLFAMGKLAGKLDRRLRPPSVATPLSQRVSLADLQALRFQAGPLADAAEALATLAGQSPGTDAHDEWPSKRRLLANVTRRQLHEDVAAVVLDIDWGRKSPGSRQPLPRPHSRNGWATARALCSFERQRRARLLERWWAVAEQLLADGRKRARQLEQAIWVSHKLVVTVTPSGSIVDSCGKVLSLGPPAMAMHVTC